MNFDKKEYQDRVSRFQQKLRSMELEGALVTQIADLYYLTGTAQNCHFFVPAEGKPLLLAYRDAGRAVEETVWDDVVVVNSIKEIPGMMKEAGWRELESLGLEMDVLTWKMGLCYRELFPGCRWEDISKTLRALRMVKSEKELEAQRYSGRKHAEAFRYIEGKIHPGMAEYEIAAEFEYYTRFLGDMGSIRFRGEEQGMRLGHVLAGVSGAVPSRYDTPLGGRGLSPLYPTGASRKRWERGEPLIIDYAAGYTPYMVDITRTYLDDYAPDILKKARDVAVEITVEVTAAAKPGAVAADLYEMAVAAAKEAGLGEHFMGQDRQVPFVGHGVGLELNEWPVIARGAKTILEEGMVFALEPKFVFKDLGSVGIEDTFVVTAKGAVSITS